MLSILKKFGNLKSLEETSKSDLDSKKALGVSVFLIKVDLQDVTLYCPPAIDWILSTIEASETIFLLITIVADFVSKSTTALSTPSVKESFFWMKGEQLWLHDMPSICITNWALPTLSSEEQARKKIVRNKYKNIFIALNNLRNVFIT